MKTIKSLFSVIVLLLVLAAGFAQAGVVWEPSGEYPDEAFWNVASNWDTDQVPGSLDKARP